MTSLVKPLANILTAVLLMAASFSNAEEPANAGDARPRILRALDGAWVMSGDVKGKPVTYKMVAARALQGTFTELRMKDVQVPAKYEATVFVGYDATSRTIIAHWIVTDLNLQFPTQQVTLTAIPFSSFFPTKPDSFETPGLIIPLPRPGNLCSSPRSQTVRGNISRATTSSGTDPTGSTTALAVCICSHVPPSRFYAKRAQYSFNCCKI